MLNALIHDLNSIDQLIRSGHFSLARQQLSIHCKNSRKIPRSLLVRVASLWRRSGASMMGLKFLRPLVRPASRRLVNPASPQELTEYAALLQRVGADNEAWRLLVSINPDEAPQALLFQAFGCFRRWDYLSAAPLLERYLQSRELTDYERMIGEVNLVSAFVETSRSEVRELLKEIKQKTLLSKSFLLHGNLLMEETKFYLNQNNRTAAMESAKQARQILGHDKTVDSLAVEKLEAVLNDLPQKLPRIRDDLRRFGGWENARDCDYQRAILNHDQSLFTHLYFGTPHSKYRERIRLHNYSPSANSYVLQLGTKGKSRLEFDTLNPRGPMKAGQIPHRLLLVLLSDFYRPWRVTELFDKLFPDQYFNPLTSPNIIHQALNRFRSAVDQLNLPLEIHHRRDGFRLSSSRRIGVRTYIHESFTGENIQRKVIESQLRAAFQNSFSRSQAQKVLGLEARTTQRLFHEMAQEGILGIDRSGPKSTYFIRETD
jgi:hypothetical protein